MRSVSDEDLHLMVVRWPVYPDAVGGIAPVIREELRRRIARKARRRAWESGRTPLIDQPLWRLAREMDQGYTVKAGGDL